MIAITTMMVVATIQSSINKMVPKTSYLKMIDYWLLYSFNIMIVIMGVHTWMDSSITRDSVTGRAINPRYPSDIQIEGLEIPGGIRIQDLVIPGGIQIEGLEIPVLYEYRVLKSQVVFKCRALKDLYVQPCCKV